jgi:hypothetical protein
MLEESESIRGPDRRDRRFKRLDQGLTDAGSGPSQQTLDSRKRLLDGVEVWQIGQQVKDLTGVRLDQLPNPPALVG